MTLSISQRIRQNVSSANLSVTPAWGVQLLKGRLVIQKDLALG